MLLTAYKAIMQCAMVALWRTGFALPPASLGIIKLRFKLSRKPSGWNRALSTVIVLDALRKQRNVSDYEVDPISEQAVIVSSKQSNFTKL